MGCEAYDPRIIYDCKTNALNGHPTKMPLQRCASLGANGKPMYHYVFFSSYREVTIEDIRRFGCLEISTVSGPSFWNGLIPLHIALPELYNQYLEALCDESPV